MSASPDAMSQMLGGLLGVQQDPQVSGGLAANAAGPYGGMNDIGLSLLAHSADGGRFGSIFGKSVLDSRELAQRSAANQLGLLNTTQDLRMKMMQQQMFQQAYPQYLAALSGQQPQSAPQGSPQGAPQGQGGLMGAPPGTPQAPQAPQGQDPLAMVRMGALGAALGMPGAKELQEYGKTQAQYNPGLATQMKAAESQVAIDQQMIQQAVGRGDYASAAAIQQKMRQDLGLLHIASMSGTQTRIGLDGQISTFNPNEGVQSVGGIESAIPGAPEARGQIEAAIARARATVEPMEVTDKVGNKYIVPRSSLAGRPSAPGPLSTPPGNTPSGSAGPVGTPGPLASIGPQQSEMLKLNAQQAGENNKSFQADVESGKDMLTNTAELRNAAADFSPGKFAESRAKAMEYLNSFNLLSKDQQSALGSAQSGQKIAIQLQAAATKQLGSREAAQIFSIMGKSLPNLTLSADGLEKVSAYMDGIARYKIARGQQAQQLMSNNDAQGVNGVRDQFVKNTNPLYFIVASANPAQQREMLDSMGERKGAFLKSWNDAARQEWAPRPGAYGVGSANAGP